MNFGGKIVVLYVSFVGLILTLVFMSYGHDVELVSKDYYAQELKYQDKLNAISNANALPKSISHKVGGGTIILTIDSSLVNTGISGTINFFRPSDSSMDTQFKMNFVEGQQVIDAKKLSHGSYKMQLTWKSSGKNYFKEEVIFIE
jgi:nitrogen fixation protein FixH